MNSPLNPPSLACSSALDSSHSWRAVAGKCMVTRRFMIESKPRALIGHARMGRQVRDGLQAAFRFRPTEMAACRKAQSFLNLPRTFVRPKCLCFQEHMCTLRGSHLNSFTCAADDSILGQYRSCLLCDKSVQKFTDDAQKKQIIK